MMTGDVRNRQYNIEDHERFLDQLIKHNGNVSKAARACGIKGGRSTVMSWIGSNAWFKEKYEEAIAIIFDDIEEFAMRKSVKSLRGAHFMLTTHKEGKARGYGKRTELSNPDGSALSWKDIVDKANESGAS